LGERHAPSGVEVNGTRPGSCARTAPAPARALVPVRGGPHVAPGCRRSGLSTVARGAQAA